MNLQIQQDPPKTGFVLMAEDRDFLERANRAECNPVLRFYQWRVPTLSLGYHQSAAVLDERQIAADRMPWVRRPTGGAAVLHSDELTYAIILPLYDKRMATLNVQELVSRAIAAGLRAVGVDADVDERGEPLSALPNRTSCFVRTSRWEVTVRGKKLVGSAQRRLANAVLQHGSILTGDDHLRIADYLALDDEQTRKRLRASLRQKATSIRAELGREVDLPLLRAALADSFLRVFGVAESLSETQPERV